MWELKRPGLGAWSCGAWGRGVEEDAQISRGEGSIPSASSALSCPRAQSDLRGLLLYLGN